MKHSPTCRSAKPAGFSLIELLVAVAVLALMTLMLGQLFSTVNTTWLGGQSRVDNFSKSRVLLDLLSEDLRKGVYRSDLCSFPNSEIALYTQRAGFSKGATNLRDVSLVTYSLQPDTTLQRADYAVTFANTAGITFGNTNSLPETANAIGRDTVSGVLGFRVFFLGTNGSLTSAYAASNGLRGFAVGLAVVDQKTLEKLSSDQITTLQSNFFNKASGTNSIRADWQHYMDSQLPWDSYPRDLARGIKIFERYVPLR
ncbi:hypothetical protein DB345_11785 [Spartobacteria bacterium LR76]|nr:hypothetical protein DB345_11785 [Spartobacteria bacterium LR76]